MAQHKHAALMKLYYEDALETETPWERWETAASEGSDYWEPLLEQPHWNVNNVYRRKRPQKKELWQWAYQVYNKWLMSGQYAGSEKEWREHTKMTTCKVRRLDHTRIEVEGD